MQDRSAFDDLNDRMLRSIAPERMRRLCARLRSRDRDFFERFSGYRVAYLQSPLVFPEGAYVALQRALDLIFDAQRILLARLLATLGREAVLRMFALPSRLLHLADWDRLEQGAAPIARPDFLLTPDGRPLVCEMNVDSSIACAETFEYLRLFAEETGLGEALSDGGVRSPYALLAEDLEARRVREGKERIVLLDWSTWEGKGYWTPDVLAGYLAARCEGVAVVACNEETYARALDAGAAGRADLVYRMFMYEDMPEGDGFYERLLASGASLYVGFESQIPNSKLWFALLHDAAFRRYLPGEHLRAIDEFTARSSHLTDDAVPRALADKDRLVFKLLSGFGGTGVLIGADTPRAALEGALRRTGSSRWIAQELIPGSRFSFGFAGEARADYNAVFGVYRIAGNSSGVLVRGNPSRRVVNVASGGSSVGWAVPGTAALAARFAQVVGGGS